MPYFEPNNRGLKFLPRSRKTGIAVAANVLSKSDSSERLGLKKRNPDSP